MFLNKDLLFQTGYGPRNSYLHNKGFCEKKFQRRHFEKISKKSMADGNEMVNWNLELKAGCGYE